VRGWTGQAEVLAGRVAASIDAALIGAAHEPFETLALDIHRYQAERDPVLAALVDGPVERWQQIPAVPISLFRELPVGTFRAEGSGVVFRTSGTTTGARGEHHLRSTALYDLAAVGWARRCVPGLPLRGAALLEDPHVAQDSSLSHMADRLCDTTWHVSGGDLDAPGLSARVAAASEPLFVASTAFALTEWLRSSPPTLPPGSVLMVTGGFKGRSTEVPAAELYAEVRRTLAPARLVEEYGMTELSSQLWGGPGLTYLPPPWLRVIAVAPDGTPVPLGEAGQLRFYDLCNLDSTLAIETMDLGRVRPDGVELLGRLQDTEPRGCSLTVEEAWARRARLTSNG
jgi:hypothetical protein